MTTSLFDFPAVALPDTAENLRLEVRAFLDEERDRGTVLGGRTPGRPTGTLV